MANNAHAAIIGAGVGGLSLANILAKAGFRVSVYEKNNSAGGRMGQLRQDGFTFDTGPSWYLMKDVFDDYFHLFGKKSSDFYELTRLDPSYKVFFENRQPLIIRGNLDVDAQTFESLEPGAGNQLRRYTVRAEKNYTLALEHFLYSNFTTVRGLANRQLARQLPSFVNAIRQPLHTYVGKQFKNQELQQILEYPAVFLGASPFNTPALYQLMSYLDFKEGVYYPKHGGMYEVIKALCKIGNELGVSYHYNQDVERIVTKAGKVAGIQIGGNTIAADIVISNADVHFTERQLLRPIERSYSEAYWTKRNPGPSALLMYLGVRGKLSELTHHNLFFVTDWERNFRKIYQDRVWPENASMYVSKTTATDTKTAPKNHENVFVLVPLPAGSSPKDANSKAEHYLQQLEHMSGIHDLRKRIVTRHIYKPEHFGKEFSAWQNTALGMSHTLSQSAFFRPSVKSKKISGLYYVGGGVQPGIGVPMCMISAQLVYKSLANDNSHGPLKSIKRLQV